MAFCTKCGKQLADGEVCSCEAPKAEAPQAESPKVEAAPQAEAPKAEAPKKKNTKMIVILAVALVAVIGILVAVLTAKPYMKPVNAFMAQINKHNPNRVELTQTLMPKFGAKALDKFYAKLMKSDELADLAEESIKSYEKSYENATDEYGKWKLSFDMKRATKLEDDEFDDVKDAIEDYYKYNLDSSLDYFKDLLKDADDLEDWADDTDVTEKEAKAILQAAINYYEAYKDLEVTEAYEVKGKFIIKAEDDEFETSMVKFITVKVNGDWFYYSVTSDDGVSFDGDNNGYFSFIRSFLRSGKLFFYAM